MNETLQQFKQALEAQYRADTGDDDGVITAYSVVAQIEYADPDHENGDQRAWGFYEGGHFTALGLTQTWADDIRYNSTDEEDDDDELV